MAATKSKRVRKRDVQQELFRHGGKRKGAGRKPKGRRAGARHQKRDDFNARHPLHVVMRVVPAVGNMRRRELYKAMREATITAALRERFRIVHISLQRTHVHMMVEAKDKLALARGGFRYRQPETSIRRSGQIDIGDGEDTCLLTAITWKSLGRQRKHIMHWRTF